MRGKSAWRCHLNLLKWRSTHEQMVKPVTQVITQLVSAVSCELSESIEFLEWFLVVNQASAQVIKHITDKQGVLRKDVYIFFFFFRRESYKSSYSLNNFLLEGEVNILNKTVQLPNAFMCKAERLIGNTIRYTQNFLSFRQTVMVERGYRKLTIQLFERSNHVHTHTQHFWFWHPAFSL